MSVCVSVCVCLSLRLSVGTADHGEAVSTSHMCAVIRACACMSPTDACMHACMHACMQDVCLCVHACIHACMHARLHTHRYRRS